MQETFIKYMKSDVEFCDEEHKKAWLLKVSQNKCKDMLRFHKVHAYIPYEEIQEHIVSHDFVDVEDIEEVIDIAKLRFWLSLVVDELNPEPLPNFEFKFVCANSLIPLAEETKQKDLFAT